MKTLTDHKTNETNGALTISVTDEAGQGGACHRYEISGFDTSSNPAGPAVPIVGQIILFQNGPIKEAGVNGVTQEALLAIVIDRLKAFDAGPFRSRENSLALTHCENALLWLHKRTRDRQLRGVEGTNQQ